MPTNLIANLRINTAPAFRDIDAFKSKIGGRTFSQPLGRISGDAAEFSKSLQAAAARVTAFGATTGAIYAVSKAISETAKSTIEVNKQLVELNTFLGASQVTLDKFGKTLFDISRLTATPFGEVAEAAKEFARQGLSLEETSKRTKDALILARVAGIGYGQAVNGITTSINSFNKEALDSTVIINKLIAVDTRFAVSAKDINEAFVRVGSAAEEAGISSSKLVAAITAAQQVTGRGGAVIGNALKTIFTRLQRTEVIDQLKDIGVAVSDQSGKLLDGIEILKNYANATRTLSQAEKNRADELLGGVYQINQLQGLVKDLTSANSVYTNALRAASTATDEATKKNEDLNKSLSARLSALSSTALQAGADIGKNILTPLMDVGISFSEIMLKALSPENYSDQADKTGKVIGDSLGKNVSKGFGQFLVVAGAPLAAAFGFAISKRLLSFGKDAIGSQLKSINAPLTRVFEGKPFFEKDYERQLNLQNQITEAVIKSGAASGMTIGNVKQEAEARKILLQYLKQENQELERKYSLTQQATSYLSQRGVETVSQVRFQSRNPKTGRFTRAASGYVPNFFMSEADQEIAQAKAFGAKNPQPRIIEAQIHGKKEPVMVNTEERVFHNVPGTGGETMILPTYRKLEDIPRMAKGYVPNFAFDSLKTWYTRDRKIADPETYSYLRYALTKDKKAINLVFSKSEQKGQGWQMFERLGKTAKRIGLPVKSDVLSSQANDVLDISDASLARAGKYGIEEVLKVAYPQLIYRQKGSSKGTSLSVNLDNGLNNTSTELSGKNIFSIVSEFASKQYKGDSKLLRNSIIDGSFDLQNIVTNFAGGRIPNFAKRRDVIQKIGKKEIFARFQKHFEKGKDYQGFYNIHGEEFTNRKLTDQEAKIYANITSAISPSVPDYVAAQFAAPIFNRFMQTRSTNVEDYFDLAPSKKVSRHKNVFGLGLFGLKGTLSKKGNIRTRDDVRRSGLSKALRGLDLGSDDTAKTRHYARAILQDKTAFPIDTNVIQAILGGKTPSKTEAAKLVSLANEFATLNKIETGAAGLQAAIFKSNSKHAEKYSPETVRSALSGIKGRSGGYVPNFAKILIAAKYYDGLKVGKAKGVEISKTGEVKNVGREVFGGIGFSTSRIGKGFASAVRTTSPTTALRKISEQAGVTKSIIVPVVASSAVNDPVPDNLKTNEALLQQFLANHPQPKEVVASLSQQGFDVKSILRSHSGSEIKSIIDILSSNSFNRGILTKSANELKDPKLVKFFAPGGIKAKGPKGTYAFGSSIAEMQQGEYASKILGKHKSYPILVTGKSGPEISEPINAEEIFPGITDNKNRLFFSSVYQFGTRVLDTDNPEHMELLGRLGYSQKILQQENLMAGGYIPNFAGLGSPLLKSVKSTLEMLKSGNVTLTDSKQLENIYNKRYGRVRGLYDGEIDEIILNKTKGTNDEFDTARLMAHEGTHRVLSRLDRENKKLLSFEEQFLMATGQAENAGLRPPVEVRKKLADASMVFADTASDDVKNYFPSYGRVTAFPELYNKSDYLEEMLADDSLDTIKGRQMLSGPLGLPVEKLTKVHRLYQRLLRASVVGISKKKSLRKLSYVPLLSSGYVPNFASTFNAEKIKKMGGYVGQANKASAPGLYNILNRIGIPIELDNITKKGLTDTLSSKENKLKLYNFLKQEPIEITNYPDSYSEVKDGNHRFTLAQFAGIKNIPAKYKDNFSGGYIPNFAGLSNAVSREKTMSGLPVSQIMAHFDGKGNPVAVTNKRDEPNGLRDVPNFAAKMPKITPQNLAAFNEILGAVIGGVTSITNVMAQNETINLDTAQNLNVAASGLSAAIGVIVGNKTLGKNATFGQRALATALPLVTAGISGGIGYLGSKQVEKGIEQQKIQRESERVAQQFSDLTNNTQELSDTLAKLDAAYRDVSTNPEELLKLTKKSTELTTRISKTNPELAAKLAGEPNVGRRIDIIQENNKIAANQQAVEQEILSLRNKPKISNEELIASFSKQIGSVGENIFKTKEGSVNEANLPKFLEENKLTKLSDFFKEQDQALQSKLRPAFIAALNSQLKLNNEAIKYNKEIIRIQGDLFKFRSKVESARELRKVSLDTRIAGVEGLQDFSQNFGSRAAISAKADTFKTIEGLKPINQFRQAVNAQVRNDQLGFSKEITNKLLSIQGPGDIAKKQLEEISKTAGLTEDQKDAINKLITQNETSTKELQKISNISEINKKNQERLLSIQERLGYGGGIKSSIDARSRVETMNAPLRGALEYQIGGALGSPRSQIAGQVNFLKSIQQLYPGLIDKTGGLDATSRSLSALRMGDLQKDLLRNSSIANQMGLTDVAEELRKKAFDPKSLAEIARTQTEAELQTGKTPSDVAEELRGVFKEFTDSLSQTFKEEAEIRKKEKEVAPEQQAATKVFQDLSKELQTKIEAAFKDAFGAEGISFKNSTIKAENAVVNVTPAPNQDKTQESTSSGTQQARAAMGTLGGYSKGFIPSFYNPLREAIKRENQYVPLSSIRVNKSNKLVNQDNPFGLAVTNTFDEPNGLKDVGLFSGGFIPNFAAFGSKAASEARRNAKLGKLYVWDNIDNGFRKVNPSGTVETDLIDRKNLPKGAKTISTELSQGGKKSIIPLKDPKVTKLDELKLPGIARSQSIDGAMSRLDKQGRLTPRNLLAEINKISGGKDVVVKTAFGESNVQSKGVYGLGGGLNTADARSIIGKYKRGTGSGFFTQEKVPTYYNELRVHVAVDDKGNVKIIKGGTVLKATGFDPSAGPSIKAYTDAGLSKNEAIKMSKSFRRSAEASAFDSIRALVKTKGIKNAFFGVDVGGTTLQSALDAGVKTREFYSGGRGRVGTIVFEVNPSDKGGSTGFMGRGLSEKLVRNIFGEKPAPSGLTTGSPAIGINPTGSPAYPPPTRPSLSSSGAPLGPGLPSGFSSKPSLASSIVNAVKNQATLTKNSFVTGFQNMAGKASGFGADLMSGAKGFGSNLMSFGKNALGKAGTGLTIAGSLGLGQEAYEALKRGEFGNAAVYGGASVGLGVGALNSIFGSKPVFNSKANRYVDPKTGRFTSAPKAGGFGKFAGGASGIASALLSGAQMVGEIKNKQYGNAAVSGAQTALYIASALSKKATGAFGIASGLGLAKDIANAKNFELASDWSDVLFGKAEQGGGIADLVGTALTAASGPIGAGVATAKIGYRIGNVIENKLGLGDKLGNAMVGSEAAARAEFASLGMAKSITKKDVVEGKQSASKYIESKRRDLEELSKGGAFKGDVIDTLNKDLDQISSRRKEREKAIEEKSRTDAIIAKRAEETKGREAGFKAEDEKRKEDQNKFDASLRRKIIEGITKNEDLSGLKTSRDRSLYLLEQEKNFGKFTEQDFAGDKSLYDSYKNYSKESEATKKKEDKFNKQIMNPEAAGGEAYRIQQFREEQQRNANELSSLPKDAFEEAARRRITAEQVMEERKKLKNKSGGFIPNFAYSRERLSVLTSPDYAGYRNAVPEPSKYYKNVVKNTAEIEVPASEVYNRMGLFGAQPKNASEKYAILNPAQQAQLGYAANGFIPNFAPEQFAGAISEALQQALSPMMERMGSSVSNSNVINVNDQRSFDMTSDKVNGVMEFLQKQFPTQFARQMGPKKV